MDRFYVFLHISVDLIIIKIFDSLFLNHRSEPLIMLKFWGLKAYSLMLLVLLSKLLSILDIFKSHPLLGLVFSFLQLLIWVKHIEDRVCSAHEVWVVCIDVRVLNFNQILHHSVCWQEILIQEFHHRVIDLSSETLKSYEFRHVYIHNDSSEFFKYHLDALQTWRL